MSEQRCNACGYDLSGLDRSQRLAARCPECGTVDPWRTPAAIRGLKRLRLASAASGLVPVALIAAALVKLEQPNRMMAEFLPSLGVNGGDGTASLIWLGLGVVAGAGLVWMVYANGIRRLAPAMIAAQARARGAAFALRWSIAVVGLGAVGFVALVIWLLVFDFPG